MIFKDLPNPGVHFPKYKATISRMVTFNTKCLKILSNKLTNMGGETLNPP